MDERQRVIRDLLLRLHEVGINPDRPFSVDFFPGEPPRFSQDESDVPSFSSDTTGGVSGSKVLTK